MKTRETTAQIYEIMAECFKEPTPEFAEDVGRGRLHEIIAGAFRQLGIEHDLGGLLPGDTTTESYQTLAAQYNLLFNHPFRHLVPVESAYEPGHRLMGNPAREMLSLFEGAGIAPPAEFAAMPDHLCLLLEFMALLCRTGTLQAQREFLAGHFDWLEKLREDSLHHDGSPFYLAAIDAVVAFVQRERWELGVTIWQVSLPQPTTLSGGER